MLFYLVKSPINPAKNPLIKASYFNYLLFFHLNKQVVAYNTILYTIGVNENPNTSLENKALISFIGLTFFFLKISVNNIVKLPFNTNPIKNPLVVKSKHCVKHPFGCLHDSCLMSRNLWFNFKYFYKTLSIFKGINNFSSFFSVFSVFSI